jgi:transcription initiation factor TFIIH subunit 2
MADSDYDQFSDDASDDEYVGPKAAASSRAQETRNKIAPKAPAPKPHAWARRGSTPEEEEYIPAEEEEDEDAAPQKSIQQLEEERKRKRYVAAAIGVCRRPC